LNKTYSAILYQLKLDLGTLEPQENDQIVFTGPEEAAALHTTLANFGSVSSSAFFKLTKASRSDVRPPFLGCYLSDNVTSEFLFFVIKAILMFFRKL
jgi:hypothetical protein